MNETWGRKAKMMCEDEEGFKELSLDDDRYEILMIAAEDRSFYAFLVLRRAIVNIVRPRVMLRKEAEFFGGISFRELCGPKSSTIQVSTVSSNEHCFCWRRQEGG